MTVQPSEDQEQIALAKFLDRHLGEYAWCHIPNEAKRSKKQGAILKQKGLKAGCPDVIIWAHHHESDKPLFIELKTRDGGTVSNAQLGFIMELSSQGFICSISYGAQSAIDFLTSEGYVKTNGTNE